MLIVKETHTDTHRHTHRHPLVTSRDACASKNEKKKMMFIPSWIISWEHFIGGYLPALAMEIKATDHAQCLI